MEGRRRISDILGRDFEPFGTAVLAMSAGIMSLEGWPAQALNVPPESVFARESVAT